MQIYDPKLYDRHRQAHLNWVRELKPGDLICNCRFEHLRIQDIIDQQYNWEPQLWRNFCFASWMPFKISDFLDKAWHWAIGKLGIKILIDRQLLLSDGSYCSAMDCCNPVAHAWSHILKSKKDLEEESYKEG